jgi:hypothetical protein
MKARHISKALSVLPIGLLGGCANDSDLVQVGRVYASYIGGSNVKITRDQAAAIPFATMGLELGSNPQALLILGMVATDELNWYAKDQLFVATQRGRVIRTVGLPFDLGALYIPPANPQIPESPMNAGTERLRFSVDFPDLGIFNAPAECSRKDAGDDTVEIFGASIPTRRIVEHCTVPAMRWSFDNQFWEDRTSGYVWRSSQHIHPKSPPVVLEVFRPEQIGAQ